MRVARRVTMPPGNPGIVKDPDDAFLSTYITPNHAHYVLAHLGIAQCEPDGWTLEITGSVTEPLSLTLDDIARMPARRVTTTLACAGDPHRLDLPKRRASTAVWCGVPLADLLRLARPAPGASHLWLDGADHGTYEAGTSNEAAVDRYRKNLPLDKALDRSVLVAYEMNGEPLPAEHGFPLRAVVPGYYGTSSVKWLGQVTVAKRPARGLFTSVLYTTTSHVGGRLVKRPVAEMAVNTLITEPRPSAVLDRGPTRVAGWAWGDREVVAVELSADTGKSWRQATVDRRRERAWQRFSVTWVAERPGARRLTVRATDDTGATQPPDCHVNQVATVEVEVCDRRHL